MEEKRRHSILFYSNRRCDDGSITRFSPKVSCFREGVDALVSGEDPMREELLFRIQEAFRKDEKMSRKLLTTNL